MVALDRPHFRDRWRASIVPITQPFDQPHHQQSDYDTTLSRDDRRRLGAWYTPPALVELVVDAAVAHVQPGQRVRVLDPACGDGRFLQGVARAVRARGGVAELTGVDIDLSGLRSRVGSGSGDEAIEAIESDSLDYDWGQRGFDIVIGNPPFLSRLASATGVAGSSRFGAGTYADAAADFLALSLRLAGRCQGTVRADPAVVAADDSRRRPRAPGSRTRRVDRMVLVVE